MAKQQTSLTLTKLTFVGMMVCLIGLIVIQFFK